MGIFRKMTPALYSLLLTEKPLNVKGLVFQTGSYMKAIVSTI